MTHTFLYEGSLNRRMATLSAGKSQTCIPAVNVPVAVCALMV